MDDKQDIINSIQNKSINDIHTILRDVEQRLMRIEKEVCELYEEIKHHD